MNPPMECLRSPKRWRSLSPAAANFIFPTESSSLYGKKIWLPSFQSPASQSVSQNHTNNLCLSHWFGIFVGEHGYKNEAIQDLFPQLLWLFPNHITLQAPSAFVTNLKSILLGFSNKCFCQATHSAYVMLSLWIHKTYPIKSQSWETGEVRLSRPILQSHLARWPCNSQGRTSHPSSSLLLSGPARPKPVSRRQGCSKEHEERELCRKRGPCQHECSQQPSGRTAGPLCWSQGW